jgi:uncharacterized pyridoxal phosphate-containing UPF0001 family protein
MKFNPAPIFRSVKIIEDTIPINVILLAAAKTRSLEEVEAVIQAGVAHIGYNYVQEAIPIIQSIGNMIETVDSWRLAQTIDRYCEQIQKIMPVLVEINSGREANKTGVLPEEVDDLIQKMAALANIHIEGLMTMGPRFGNPEDARPYFKATREIFEKIAANKLPNVNMRFLSMGMSNSYQIAIEEGANIIRIGSKLFGQRQTSVKNG